MAKVFFKNENNLNHAHLIPVLTLIIIGIISHIKWFDNLSILVYGDCFIDYSERLMEFYALPQAWISTGIGGLNIGAVFWPLLYGTGALANWGFSPGLIERILYLWPIALLTPIGMYLLAFYILKSRAGSFISAIAFSYNIPLIVMSTGIITSHMAITLSPFLILVFILAIDRASFFSAILFCLLIFLIGTYDFRYLYLDFLICLIYTIYSFKFLKFQINSFIKRICILFFILIFSILLNFYWLPMLTIPNIGAGISDRPLWGSQFVPLSYAIFLFQYIWTGGLMEAFSIQEISLLCLPIPFFAALGLYYEKSNKFIIFFGVIALIGILLTKLDHPPFTNLYLWLYLNLPGFGLFRDSSKFYYYIFLGYSLLIGGFIKHISTFKSKRYLYFFTTFILAIFLYNTKPLITGEIQTIYIERKAPNDYLLLKSFLLKQNDFFRTLYFPRESNWGFYNNLHPKISAINMIYGDWAKFSIKDKEPIDQFQSLIQNEKFNSLINLSAVKYIVVPLVDLENDDNFFVYYGNTRKKYIELLSSNLSLKKIEFGAKELVVFENTDYKPLFYTTKDALSLNRDLPTENKVIASCPSVTECNVSIINFNESTYLNFSNKFNPGWVIQFLNSKLGSSAISVANSPSDFHFENEAGLNSYFLDIGKIKKLYPEYLTTDNDGLSTLNLNVYFKPQESLAKGVKITIFSLAILGILIFLNVLSRVYFRKNT